jgi:hypothetical protein
MVEMKACTTALFKPLFVGEICEAVHTRFISDRETMQVEI